MHSFKVLDQLLAAGIDLEPALTSLVTEHCVHTIDSVFDRRIRRRDLPRDIAELMGEEIFNDLPVGARGRSLAATPGGITVDVELRCID